MKIAFVLLTMSKIEGALYSATATVPLYANMLNVDKVEEQRMIQQVLNEAPENNPGWSNFKAITVYVPDDCIDFVVAYTENKLHLTKEL